MPSVYLLWYWWRRSGCSVEFRRLPSWWDLWKTFMKKWNPYIALHKIDEPYYSILSLSLSKFSSNYFRAIMTVYLSASASMEDTPYESALHDSIDKKLVWGAYRTAVLDELRCRCSEKICQRGIYRESGYVSVSDWLRGWIWLYDHLASSGIKTDQDCKHFHCDYAMRSNFHRKYAEYAEVFASDWRSLWRVVFQCTHIRNLARRSVFEVPGHHL